VLLPTAEEDPVIRLRILDRFFAQPAGFLFLTPEEQALVTLQCSRPLAPSAVIGTGLEPAAVRLGTELESMGVRKPYLLYLGRIDPNKGCATLIRHFQRYAMTQPVAPKLDATVDERRLVMAGPANMPIPDDPSIIRLGFVPERVREALLSNASVLVVPSPYESLSIVLLEAWNHGIPALVNGRCGVLKGQALRADGALYYQNYDEFSRGLDYLLGRPDLARQLGRQGLAYVDREYRWPHVVHKIERLLGSIGAADVAELSM
jgi:glycosyltransferase involved in cell wall biosynthesis